MYEVYFPKAFLIVIEINDPRHTCQTLFRGIFVLQCIHRFISAFSIWSHMCCVGIAVKLSLNANSRTKVLYLACNLQLYKYKYKYNTH